MLRGTIPELEKTSINQPIKNFETLWSRFNSEYASFELKEVDWQEMYAIYRPQVSEKTTNEELFKICSSMVQRLNDGHCTITANFEDGQVECAAPYPHRFKNYFFSGHGWESESTTNFLELIDKTLMDNGFHKPISNAGVVDYFINYSNSDKYGYISTGMYRPQLKLIEKLIEKYSDLEGIILDLRYNRGGSPDIAGKIAGKFTDKESIGHYVRFRKKGNNGFTPLIEKKVKPIGKVQFTKPVIVLTSDATASTTEIFLLAVKDFPNITLLGDRTEGIISSVNTFRLPNRWKVMLSDNQT